VIDASSGNDRPDALLAKALPDGLAVVAPVGVDHVGMLPRSAGLAAYLGKVLDHRKNQFVVADVRWGGLGHEQHAVCVDEQRVFRSKFPAVNRARPRRIPATESPHENAVDYRQFSFEDGRLPKSRQEVEMQSLQDPTGIPPLKAAMRRSPRSAEFQRHILPAAAGHEHKPDHLHDNSMRYGRSATALPHRLLGGKKMATTRRRTHRASLHLPSWLPPRFTWTLEGHAQMTCRIKFCQCL
jgi:hypothetical protein